MNSVYNLLGRKIFYILLFSFIKIHVGFSQSFSSSDLQNISIVSPTSLQFGPDGKLYVAQQDGLIKIFTIVKNGTNNYSTTHTEVSNLIQLIPNHNDDGSKFILTDAAGKRRQCTGIYVTGTADAPIIYATSSDFRSGGGEKGDIGLCTNSGILSKLYKENGAWKKIDLVRGLPRSEESHSPHGLQIYENKLLISVGGMTNSGSPSRFWTFSSEYALSSAVIVVELDRIEAMPTKMDPSGINPYKYDIPTLDDPTRPNNPDGTDVNDPWGGNDGLNQAKIVPGGPVQVFAGGFRNAYDLLISKYPGREGRVFIMDNGPNRNWGGYPAHNGEGTATNEYVVGEPGSLSVGNFDGFEFIGDINNYTYGSYYGGHPNPIRSNPSGAGLFTDNGLVNGWRNDNSNPDLPLPSDWPPVPVADPQEGKYLNAGTGADKALIYFINSTNGLCEYLYSQNEMFGDMLAVSMNGNVYRIKMDNNFKVTNTKDANRNNLDAPIASGFGNKPLDITAQGDGEAFAGTIWVATWGANSITILEPQVLSCVLGNPNDDDDGDGFTNADEAANHTNPCSGSSKPNDFDRDHISDLNDTDDDGDGILDKDDHFAIDRYNGTKTNIPITYDFYNYDPGTGFFGLGFTGLMNNGSTDYLTQYQENNMITGGAAGVMTIEEVPNGDAEGNLNNQQYAFQFGVNIDPSEGMFTVKSMILPSFFNAETPVDIQSQGIYIGNGDQDNYIKLAIHSNGGNGGIQLATEADGIFNSTIVPFQNGIPIEAILLYFTVDTDAKLVYAKYMVGSTSYSVGTPVPLTGKILDAIQDPNKALAVGIIATSRQSNKPFNASWDEIRVYSGSVLAVNKGDDVLDNINLFPNPGKDKVSININSVVAQNYNIRFINSLGQQVKNIDIYHSTSNGDYELDISDLINGLYFVHLTSEKEKKYSTITFIKK